MKASDLIKRLQDFIDQYGDQLVYVDGDYFRVYSITYGPLPFNNPDEMAFLLS